MITVDPSTNKMLLSLSPKGFIHDVSSGRFVKETFDYRVTL
jgi:hypothetical protein